MKTTRKMLVWMGMTGLALLLVGCGASGKGGGAVTEPVATATGIEATLPLVRMGAAVATGGVLDFAVQTNETRTRLANQMYAAAKAVYSLTGATLPTPGEFEASVLAFGGTQADVVYGKFAAAMAGLYAAYYPKLMPGEAKAGVDLLNAIAGGIEDATRAYVMTPVVVNVEEPVSF